MLKSIKLVSLKVLRAGGAFDLVRDSAWRRKRLLILCYHGISLEDEHLWRPRLYIHPEVLKRRLDALQKGGFSVLPLGEALQKLRDAELPPRSVALTFDDGTFDFYKVARPLLKAYGFPVTVYQTTYYTLHEMPIFNLICSYMLWKRRGEVLPPPLKLGLTEPLDLRSEAGRHRVVRSLIELSNRDALNGAQKNEIARHLAAYLAIDYDSLVAKRLLQLMNAREITEVANDGIDMQLHTHRHRTPDREAAFRREIQENRDAIRSLTGHNAEHFCYPSGVYRAEWLPWLAGENVLSATTCDAGMATFRSHPLLLPRFVDTTQCTEVEFQGWISGLGDLLAMHRKAPQQYVPQEA